MRRPELSIAILLIITSFVDCRADDAVTVVSWGGVYESAQKQAIFDPFTRSTGIAVNALTYNGGVDTLQDRASKEGWDVIDMIEDQAITACDADLLTKIDAAEIIKAYYSIPLAKDFVPKAMRKCSVAQNIYATVFAYDDRAFLGEKPESVADFFDLERFPGERALMRDPDVILEWALMAEGVPPDQVYDLLSTDRGLRLAFRKLEDLRGSIVWWEDADSPSKMLADGSAVMASGYNGQFFSAVQDSNAPITIVWDGHVINYEVWVIPRGAPNQDLAELFLRFATAPAQMAALAELMPYGPTRESALSRIGLHRTSRIPMRDQLPNAPQHSARALYGDSLWYARTKELRSRRFESWLNAQ